MRERFLSEARENSADAKRTDECDPPHPDRSYLEDRPWIVYDRESKGDDFAVSALRRGAVFVSCPDFRPEVLKAAEESGRPLAEIVARPLPGLLPPPAPVIVGLPSVIAETVSDDTGGTTEPGLAVAVTTPPPALQPRRRRGGLVIGGAVAFAAVAALVIGAAATQPSLSNVLGHTGTVITPVTMPAIAAPASEGALAPPVVVDIDLDDVPVKPAAKSEPKSRFGRLTIRSEAKRKNVYFDGKRMLGAGSRSFLVACGMHTIAVTDKTDAKDVEVPCDGELVVAR